MFLSPCDVAALCMSSNARFEAAGTKAPSFRKTGTTICGMIYKDGKHTHGWNGGEEQMGWHGMGWDGMGCAGMTTCRRLARFVASCDITVLSFTPDAM